MSDKESPAGKKRLIEKCVVASVELTRYAIKGKKPDHKKPVMTTHGEVAFLEKGVTNWRLDVVKKKIIASAKTETPLVSVKADWYTAQYALEKGIRAVHGSGANTFGSLGVLLLPDDFNIPTVLADRENVKHYGLQLIEDQEAFAVSCGQFPIALMRYNYGRDYKKDFLMRKQGGGGIFVETHDFPHVHIPLSKRCGGYIVIGKRLSGRKFHFTAFQIPFGHALYTPSGTIHGDGTLVGEYALTIADPAMCHADTVLMYNKKTRSMARKVVPDWKP